MVPSRRGWVTSTWPTYARKRRRPVESGVGEPARGGEDHPLIRNSVSHAQARHEEAVFGSVEIIVLVWSRDHGGELAAVGGGAQDIQAQRAPFLVHIMGNLKEIPAQTHVDGQLTRSLPLVLEVGAPAILPRRSPGEAFGAGTGAGIAEQPSGQRIAARTADHVAQ